jgi:hypothetical protein
MEAYLMNVNHESKSVAIFTVQALGVDLIKQFWSKFINYLCRLGCFTTRKVFLPTLQKDLAYKQE